MSNVIVSIDSSVGVITLNRPDKKNALTKEMYQAMADALTSMNDNADVRAIVIRANGGCFCAGNDIQNFASREDGQKVIETVAFMQALSNSNLPIVAEVSGLAVGIGTTMLLHCDFVYCTSDTKFILPFINLGLVPEFASSYLLPKLAGHRKAAEWLMLGEPIDPNSAYTFGLVTEIVSENALADKVKSVAQALAQKPAFALRQTKLLLKTEANDIHDHMNVELDIFVEAMATEAAQEAFDAFLHKRPINPEKFK